MHSQIEVLAQTSEGIATWMSALSLIFALAIGIGFGILLGCLGMESNLEV